MKNLYLEIKRFERKEKEEENNLAFSLIKFSDSGVFESRFTTKTEVYKDSLKEYGKCISKVYIDKKDGSTQSIGYVFQKTEYYEDTREPFTCETWITIHDKEPEKTIKYFYTD